MEAVTNIDIHEYVSGGSLTLTLTDADQTALQTLLTGCKNLKTLNLSNCDLSGFNFSVLDNSGLTDLSLYRSSINSVPDLTLPSLTHLYLSRNPLSAESIQNNLTHGKLPKLTNLYLDACSISDVSFLANMENLQTLTLGTGGLTDDSVATLLGMKDKLSSLKTLNLGETIYTGSGTERITGDSSNHLTNLDNLALLPESFPMLTSLNLSGLKITTLENFQNVRDDINIDFTQNRIVDFTGLESKPKFDVTEQEISLSDKFAKGWGSELPELLNRILDENDVLKGTLRYENCSLSDDNKKIIIQPDATKASATVSGGKIRGTKINFSLKELPAPEIPDNLTAELVIRLHRSPCQTALHGRTLHRMSALWEPIHFRLFIQNRMKALIIFWILMYQ